MYLRDSPRIQSEQKGARRDLPGVSFYTDPRLWAVWSFCSVLSNHYLRLRLRHALRLCNPGTRAQADSAMRLSVSQIHLFAVKLK